MRASEERAKTWAALAGALAVMAMTPGCDRSAAPAARPAVASAPSQGGAPGAQEASAEAHPSQQPAPDQTDPAPEAEREDAQPRTPVDQEALRERYVWLEPQRNLGQLTTLRRRFEAPAGFERVEVEPGSYQAYLRGLPLRTDRTRTRLYNGDPVRMPSAAIIPLELGPRDLHQCADSVIRLHGEWLWASGQAEQASYHYTSGDLAAWEDWRRGRPLEVRGGQVRQVERAPAPNTWRAYRRWLDEIFRYASTRSMHRDAERVTDPEELRAGDFFLMAGNPGHVIVLLDVATHPDGRRAALIGQGYIPAREVHVIGVRAREDVLDRVWFVLPEGPDDEIDTPTWHPFTMEHAMRFETP